MISFRHAQGTNMASILVRGRPIDYEFATAIVHLLNTGVVQRMFAEDLYPGVTEPRRFALLEKTVEGWKEFKGHYLSKAGPLAIYLGNRTILVPEEPTTYEQLEKIGNFNTFLTPVMAGRAAPESDES